VPVAKQAEADGARDAGGSLHPRMHAPADDGSPGPGLTAGDAAFFRLI
jgi:hypothetical protein